MKAATIKGPWKKVVSAVECQRKGVIPNMQETLECGHTRSFNLDTPKANYKPAKKRRCCECYFEQCRKEGKTP